MARKALLRLQTVVIILHGQKIITNHELLIRYIFFIRTQLINKFIGWIVSQSVSQSANQQI